MAQNNTQTEITEVEAMQMAIDNFQQQAPRNCGVMYEPYMAVVKWLQELAAFKDETPITTEILDSVRKSINKSNDVEMICIQYDTDCYYAEIKYIEDKFEFGNRYNPVMQWKCPVHTVGQLRMFLTICGLGDFVKQFKA